MSKRIPSPLTKEADHPGYRVGEFHLHGPQGPLEKHGQSIKLQPKALGVLWVLAQHKGEVAGKQALLDAVWPGVVVGDEALTFQIQALRRVLEPDPRNPKHLVTVHRIGFRLLGVETVGLAPASEAPQVTESAPLFGRDAEVRTLMQAWERALKGQRQMFFVTGEAGIGKSRLAESFLERVLAIRGSVAMARGYCPQVAEEAEPFLPLLDVLGQITRLSSDDLPVQLMQQLAPNWIAQLPDLTSQGERKQLQRQTSGVRPERMLREFVDFIEQLSAKRPLLVLLEDLHWSDAPTIDALSLLAQRRSPARLMLVMTLRNVEPILSNHPVRKLRQTLTARDLATELRLGSLDISAAQAWVSQRLGTRVGRKHMSSIHERTLGHPLFLTQVCDYLATRELSDATVSELPPGIRAMIELQVADLLLSDQLLLEVASLAGTEFSAAAVAYGSGVALGAVETALDRLAASGRFVESTGIAIWPNGTTSGRFRFRHVLYQQVLHDRIAQTRRARLHRTMTEHVEACYGSRASDIAIEIAYHYEAAGALDRAIPYVSHLAYQAFVRAAHDDALAQTKRGLNLLSSLEGGDSLRQMELRLRSIECATLQARHGYSHALVAPTVDALAGLLEYGTGDPELTIWATGMQWLHHHFALRLDQALRFAELAQSVGRRQHYPALECAGYAWASYSLALMGRPREADSASRKACALAEKILTVNPDLGALEPGCAALGSLAFTQWVQGLYEQSIRTAQQAMDGYSRIGNPYYNVLARVAIRQNLQMYRREFADVISEFSSIKSLCEQYSMSDALSWANRNYLAALGITKRTREPLAELRSRMGAQQLTGNMVGYMMETLLDVEICIATGDLSEARDGMERVFDSMRSHAARAMETEVWRVEGELRRLESANPDAAEDAYRRSIALCHERGALSFELRSSLGLARLLADHRRKKNAASLLQDVCDRFTEGFSTSEMTQARTLISAYIG